MGTPCALKWREAGERERVWIVNKAHPIARGLPDCFELEHEEMYGEPFSVPEPLETVFISWFQGGEVFRSGLTYQRGPEKSSTSGRATKHIPRTTMRTSRRYFVTLCVGLRSRVGGIVYAMRQMFRQTGRRSL